ncbi:MAG: UDP-N-acetylmuramoyl-L-alanyl-D-glutamate--2,6-diaminopimelate ligase [Acidimicrobiales bacterium]
MGRDAASGPREGERGGPVKLDLLVERIGAEPVGPPVSGVAVNGVVFDHRQVNAPTPGGGDLFVCVPGERFDGHDFAVEAVEAGAVALVVEHVVEGCRAAPQLVVGGGRARAAMALASCAVSGDPAGSLRTVGVTGTNGKTTTSFMLKSIFEANGWPTVLVGTLGGARTTPEAPVLQATLARALVSAKTVAVLEVTSHALTQHRVDGYVHDVAVFTNLSQDHLDYHHTMEAYFGAKAELFTTSHAATGVVNADDVYGRKLLEGPSEIPLCPFSIGEVAELAYSARGSRFLLRGHPVQLRLAGELNVRNAVAAAAAARAAGVDDATIAAGLSSAEQVPGRFEAVANALSLSVIVDYAHTPAGLSEALRVVRGSAPSGRLVVVFGAGGDRDRQKRPLMGEAAQRLSDVAIVTSDNPRHESPEEIIAEVVGTWSGPARLVVEPDRRAAIASALCIAGPGDVVLVAGKGHETTQQVGDELLAFEDRAVVAEEAERLAGDR